MPTPPPPPLKHTHSCSNKNLGWKIIQLQAHTQNDFFCCLCLKLLVHNWYGKQERVVTFFTTTISPLLPKPPFSSQVKVIGQFVYNRTGRFLPMTEIFSFEPETFLVVVYLTCKHIVGPMSWCSMSGRWAVWGFPFAGQKQMSTNAFSVDASWSLCTIPMAICSLDFFFFSEVREG